jgi:hypothetical protein
VQASAWPPSPRWISSRQCCIWIEARHPLK